MESCSICYEKSEFSCVGECNHPICMKCGVRWRVICETTNCPICSTRLNEVIIIDSGDSEQTFSELASGGGEACIEWKCGLKVQGEAALKASRELLANVCGFCKVGREFPTFNRLRDHMRAEHRLLYCDLCVKHLKLFPSERKCYRRDQLFSHNDIGDPSDPGYRGHPSCQFCKGKRFYCEYELYKHLRQQHYICDGCSDNGKYVFFMSSQELKEHWSSEHGVRQRNGPATDKYGDGYKAVPNQSTVTDYLHGPMFDAPSFRGRSDPNFPSSSTRQYPSSLDVQTEKVIDRGSRSVAAKKAGIMSQDKRFVLIDDDEDYASKREPPNAAAKSDVMENGWQSRIRTLERSVHVSGDDKDKESRRIAFPGYSASLFHPKNGKKVDKKESGKKPGLEKVPMSVLQKVPEPVLEKEPDPPSDSVIIPVWKYSKPSQFSSRNRTLLDTLSSVLDNDQDRLNSFREHSMEFQRGIIDPESYCTWMRVLIDDDQAYVGVFTELVCLLPNIDKQQGLLDAFRDTGLAYCQDGMKKCGRCGQWLMKMDFTDHKCIGPYH